MLPRSEEYCTEDVECDVVGMGGKLLARGWRPGGVARTYSQIKDVGDANCMDFAWLCVKSELGTQASTLVVATAKYCLVPKYKHF